jgi:fluoride exporter
VNYLLTFVGGGLGSVTRLAVNNVFGRWLGVAWPFGTLFINVTGSFVIGLFLTVAGEKLGLAPAWRYFVATGFLGGYTTFSSFEYETQRLVELGTPWYATAYVGASVVLGFIAAVLAVALARRI